MRTFIGSIFLLAAPSLTLQAVAQDTNWKLERVSQSMDIKGSAQKDYSYTSLIINSTNPDAPEIRFGCSERYGLTATVTFLPANEADPRKSARVKMRQMTTNMTIEGRDAVRVPWTVVKETRTVQARSGKHAAMMYNAVVQGLTIKIKEPYKKDVVISPAPIDDNFTWFANNCHVTSG